MGGKGMIKKIILTLALSGILLQASAFSENIAVIVNKDSPLFSLKASPELKDIKNIYLGKTRFAGGSLVKATNQNNKELITRFIKKVCQMEVNEYQYLWVKLEFETGISAPKVTENSDEIIDYVQREKNAIGYVWESQLKDATGIKVALLIPE